MSEAESGPLTSGLPHILSAVLGGGGLGWSARTDLPRPGPGVIGRVQLDGVSVLMGPNSSGKSTVLALIEPALQRLDLDLFGERRKVNDQEIWF